MEDGRNSSISISSTSGHQQQQDLVAAGEAFGPGGAGGGWGTLEELLLVGAISRHGSGDWAAVAGELQGRARLLSMPPAYFSPEACKNKFDGLSGRYGSLGYRSGGGGRDKEPESHPAWFEDIRRRRVAQLKRELERHDGCIVSLSNKLKRLKAERAQSLQTANKQQQQQVAAAATATAGKSFLDDSSALAVAAESPKPLDSSESFKAEPETPQADGLVDDDEGIPSKPPSALDPAASAHGTPPSEPPPARSEEEADVGLPPSAPSVEAAVEAAPQELLTDEKDPSTAAAADAPDTDGSVGVEPPPPEATEPVEPAVVETDRSIEDDEIGVGVGEKAVESTEGEGITTEIHPAEDVAAAESLAAVVPHKAEEVELVDEGRPSVDDDSAVVAVDPVCTSDKVVNTPEPTESLDSKPVLESEQEAALNTEDVVEVAAMEETADAKEGNPYTDSKVEELVKLDESPEHPGGLDAQVETEEEKKPQEVDTKPEELHDEADVTKSVATEDESEVVNADADMVCLKNEAADMRTEDDDKCDDLQTAAGKDEGSLLSKVELRSSEEAAEMETDEAETAVVDTSREDEDAMDVDEAPVVRESAEVGAALAEAVESPEPSQAAEGLDVEPVPVVVQANEAERDQPVDEDVKNLEAEDAVELHPEATNSGVVDSLEPQKEAEASVVDEPMDPLTPAVGGIEPVTVAPSVPAAEVEAVEGKKTVDSDFVEPASGAAAPATSELTEAAADGPYQSESAVVSSEEVDPSTVTIEERPFPGDAGQAEEALDLSGSKDGTPLPPAEEDAGAIATTDSEAIPAENMAEDVGVKLVGEGHLVVDIVGEHPVEPSRPAEAAEEANPAEEKEASSSAVQSSSSQGTTKQSAYKEKSDESQDGGARQAESVERPETIVCKASRQDVGSPASANEDFQEEKDEGSGSAQEQSKDGSQVEKSEAGGSQVDGPEDTSPTSRRLKKESKVPGKLQPLLECLRTICAHKFAPLFKQRQESQDDPRYDQVIRRHVDLNMIRARLEEGGYSGSLEFFRDLLLIFNNGVVFYPRDSQEYNASVVLRKLTLEEMDRILQSEVLMKQDRPATRKRDSKRPVESAPVPAPVPAPAATSTSRAGVVTGSSSGKRQQGNAGLELSTSDNSKSKSASLSLGVPSSRGGEEEDAREGEPEVEGKSTAKPLKAYGRKNRGDAAQQEARRAAVAAAAAAAAGKGVARERPKESLEAIVKKIGKAEEAAAALAKETAAAAAAKETSSKATTAAKETAKAREVKEKAAAAEASKASPPAGAPAPTTSAVRGARNKRSSVKEATRAGKRTRRI